METLEVEVTGPGSGRESALRALQAVGFTITVDPRRDADPAQRLPPAASAAASEFAPRRRPPTREPRAMAAAAGLPSDCR